ncbi:MAG: TIGR04372 family glycosyltransferase [Sulfuritalea sp.]|nr:TIGR04372 family glycosyltransferase [Sulfuritalea sp.]
MIDRVINWQALARPLLRLRREGDGSIEPLESLLRLFVLRELPSFSDLPLVRLHAQENAPEHRAFLKLGPDRPAITEQNLSEFILRLSVLGILDGLRADLRQQLLPWMSWLARSDSRSIGMQIAGELLAKETPPPTTALLKDLRRLVTAHAQATGTYRVDAAASFLRARFGPLADSIVETGFSLAYEAGCLVKRTRLHRLILGRGVAQERMRRQGRGWLRDKALSVLDALLRATLRSVARGVPASVQIAPTLDTLDTASQRLARTSRLLRLRGRLFLATGDYDRAYRFLLVAAAWGAENGLPLFHVGIAAQLSGRFIVAEGFYRTVILTGTQNPDLLRNLGHVLLGLGKEREAYAYLQRSARESYGHFMPHQNLAASYDTARFAPRAFDRASHPQTLLYDAYNLVGERLVHIGEGERGVQCYGAALRNQDEFAGAIRLPDEIRKILSEEYGIAIHDPVRILPYEWVTLIGHIAMLDSYLKLQKLGMGKPGRPLLLAPANKVANRTFLDLWRPHVTVIEDSFLVDDLFPYQRAFGDCFNGYLRTDGSAGDWTEFGALGQIAWDITGQGPLIEIPDRLRSEGTKFLQKMGLGSSDWFVALHIRGTGYHREAKGSMQVHRNAAAEDYIPAIKAVTDRGGWVIRMGDTSMEPLPPMERVVDYPHSEFKSEQCDIFLAATARFFIGTTSGLTNVVMSLGTPCLLVNCISNYFQLWNNRVLFMIKPLWHRTEMRYLTVSEMTAESFRWKIFNTNRLEALGIEPHANMPDEILAATVEMLQRVEGGKVMEITEADQVLQSLCEAAGNRSYFGNGRLSESFFVRRRIDLFQAVNDGINADLAIGKPKLAR